MTLDAARQDRHRGALLGIGAALTTGEEGWRKLALHLAMSLSEDERGRLAVACLRAMPDDVAFETAQDAFAASQHLPPFHRPEDTATLLEWARVWAGETSQSDLRAHGVAIVEAMHPRTRRAFAQWLADRELRPALKIAAE